MRWSLKFTTSIATKKGALPVPATHIRTREKSPKRFVTDVRICVRYRNILPYVIFKILRKLKKQYRKLKNQTIDNAIKNDVTYNFKIAIHYSI